MSPSRPDDWQSDLPLRPRERSSNVVSAARFKIVGVMQQLLRQSKGHNPHDRPATGKSGAPGPPAAAASTAVAAGAVAASQAHPARRTLAAHKPDLRNRK